MRMNGMLRASAVMLCFIWMGGCKSAPPPAPVPLARMQATRQAEEAAKLSQAENWTAAAQAWQMAADRFALLNDRADEAVAWHNLGQAQHETGGSDDFAHESFEQAAQINRQLGMTNAWWRNQIALVQLEMSNTNAVASRFKSLSALKPPAELQGFYENELGRFQTEIGDFASASRAFDQAKIIFEQDKNHSGLAAVSMNRALLLSRQKQFPAALTEWRRARAQCEALADPSGLARALLGEGQTLLAAGQDLPQAERLLRQAARNYATLRRVADQKRALTVLIECLQAQNKPADLEQARLEELKKNP